MNQVLKQIIKKSVSENLPKPYFINMQFTGAIGGWEEMLSNDEFRRFTITRQETEDGLVYGLEARNLVIGNPKQRLHNTPFIKITLNSLEKFNCVTLEDWLTTTPGTERNLDKLQQKKDGIIKFIADDLIKIEQERHLKEFLASL